jgi:hypothetical protein
VHLQHVCGKPGPSCQFMGRAPGVQNLKLLLLEHLLEPRCAAILEAEAVCPPGNLKHKANKDWVHKVAQAIHRAPSLSTVICALQAADKECGFAPPRVGFEWIILQAQRVQHLLRKGRRSRFPSRRKAKAELHVLCASKQLLKMQSVF